MTTRDGNEYRSYCVIRFALRRVMRNPDDHLCRAGRVTTVSDSCSSGAVLDFTAKSILPKQ